MKISSIIKKVIMALTGLALVGFLVAHLAGNLLIYKVGDPKTPGAAFVAYGQMLEHNPLLPFAEIGLFAVFVIHIFNALFLTKANSSARPIGYTERKTAGESTLSSRTMWITGLVVFGFLFLHIGRFKFGDKGSEGEKLWSMVVGEFQDPVIMGVYLVAMLSLGFHISHGISSAFQSLGLFSGNRRKLRTAGMVLGWALALGFASIPVWSMTMAPKIAKTTATEKAKEPVVAPK